jgi:hypothetical protein
MANRLRAILMQTADQYVLFATESQIDHIFTGTQFVSCHFQWFSLLANISAESVN